MGFPQTLQAILGKGANVRAVTRHRRSALHYAVQEWHMECVDLLHQAGVPLHVRDKSGNTAEMLAIKCGQQGAANAIKAATVTSTTEGESMARESEGMVGVTAGLQATSLTGDADSLT